MDWGGVGSGLGFGVDAKPVHCGEERVELEEEALNLLVNLRSNPQLWSFAPGGDQKIKIVDTSGRH